MYTRRGYELAVSKRGLNLACMHVFVCTCMCLYEHACILGVDYSIYYGNRNCTHALPASKHGGKELLFRFCVRLVFVCRHALPDVCCAYMCVSTCCCFGSVFASMRYQMEQKNKALVKMMNLVYTFTKVPVTLCLGARVLGNKIHDKFQSSYTWINLNQSGPKHQQHPSIYQMNIEALFR